MKYGKIKHVFAIMLVFVLVFSSGAQAISMTFFAPSRMVQTSKTIAPDAITTSNNNIVVATKQKLAPQLSLAPEHLSPEVLPQEEEDDRLDDSPVDPAPEGVAVTKDEDDSKDGVLQSERFTLPGSVVLVPKEDPEVSDDDSSSDSNSVSVDKHIPGWTGWDYGRLAPQVVDEDDDGSVKVVPQLELERLAPELQRGREFFNILKPDLKVVSLNIPSRANYGDTVSVGYTVENIGDRSATFNVGFYKGDYAFSKIPDSVQSVSLSAGQTYTGTFRYVYQDNSVRDFSEPVMPDLLRPKIIVDYDHKITEYDEGNNYKVGKLWVYPAKPQAPPQYPDLRTQLYVTDRTYEPNEHVNFGLYVENIGDATATDFILTFYDGKNEEPFMRQLTLAPGEYERIDQIRTYSAGAYHAVLKADEFHTVAESNENNNWAGVRVSVEEPAPVLVACNDRLDNDGDGLVDMDDPGCSVPTDDDESDDPESLSYTQIDCINQVVHNSALETVVFQRCDADLFAAMPEYSGYDEQELAFLAYGCALGFSDLEPRLRECVEGSSVPLPACSDNSDNDGDGLVDMDDPGCSVPTDDDESDDPVVVPGNEAPNAVVVVTPDGGSVPLTVSVEGTDSYDTDGTITEHSWIITGPDGYAYDEIAVSGAPTTLSLTWTEAGDYTVRLNVRDDEGATDSAQTTVTVTDDQSTQPVDPESYCSTVTGSYDARDLSFYPHMFLNGNSFDGVFVVGDAGSSTEVVAMTDIADSLQTDYGTPITVGSAALDSAITDATAQNVISIGSACVNSVTADLLGLDPADCMDLEPGEGVIRLVDNGPTVGLLVYGYEDADTTRAAQFLADHIDHPCALHGDAIMVYSDGTTGPDDGTGDDGNGDDGTNQDNNQSVTCALDITSVDMSETSVEDGQSFTANVTASNNCSLTADDAEVVMTMPDLGLESLPVYMDVPGEDSATSGNLFLRVPENTPAGPYAVVFNVTHEGASVVQDETLTVTEAPISFGNEAPVPVVSVDPASGDAPVNVTISGDGSFDPDGQIVEHSWIIVGPEGFTAMWLSETGEPLDHVVELPYSGDYSVELVIVDDQGAAMNLAVNFALTGNVTAGDSDNNTSNSDDGSDGGAGDDSGSGDNSNDGNNDNNDNTSVLAEPYIKNIDVEDVKYDEATITWETTNVDSDSKVCFGTKDDTLDDCGSDNDLVDEHKITIDGLDEQTKYYYSVKSCNDDDVCSEKGPYKFTTLLENTVNNNDDNANADDYDWSDLSLDTEAFLRNVPQASSSTTSQSESTGSEPVVEAPQEPTVDVVFAPVQYIEVEQEVCKLRFLWWCVWKDSVVKKIPLPALIPGSGVEFEVE